MEKIIELLNIYTEIDHQNDLWSSKLNAFKESNENYQNIYLELRGYIDILIEKTGNINKSKKYNYVSLEPIKKQKI
ncbi:hypothetical protein ASO20_02960 [Mycoplasma sp. (ex Biomphalaria glabrata)]|uniref:hypothetical protein n=1 Tax=Mycoplasma sp. (ex Biomphalaria glabrata) TaxID=1749074 RepID=UPI00073AAE3C|nr:hypothetical protein [Mycoplasma sp. (ex Biomphalaria glabrata)]ALV23593.1 hypothetical protein ASO20_02960 [Mycoplasma sp. (ex Biomphalaria glabrata)]